MVSNPSVQKASWSRDVQQVSQYTEPEKDSLLDLFQTIPKVKLAF
jgi:hypothetical protein